jgi:hypothetical protein
MPSILSKCFRVQERVVPLGLDTMVLQSLQHYDTCVEAMMDIEFADVPEDYENIALLCAMWLQQQSSLALGIEAWVCTLGVNVLTGGQDMPDLR